MPTRKKGRKRDPRLKRAGVSGFNKPKRTPGHRTKSHIVVAKVGGKIKTIRFGQKGAKTAGKPKAADILPLAMFLLCLALKLLRFIFILRDSPALGKMVKSEL